MTQVQETLDAKLPRLLEQHPGMDETFVRTIALADPTGCRYVSWLLKTLQENQWDLADSDSMFSALSAFDQLKDGEHWEGSKDINQYTKVDDLVAAINAHVETTVIPEKPPEQNHVEGAKQVAVSGNLEVWEISTPEAAALYGCGQGGVENPSTEWPTKNHKLAAKYLVNGPLYVVTRDGQSIYQIHFSRNEARNERNLELTADQAKEIAPLFTGQSFASELGKLPYQPGGWQLTDTDIDNYLKQLKSRFIAQRRHGFYLNGQWIEPVSDEALLERRWKKKEPEFEHALKQAQSDHDEEIIRRAGRKHPQPTGLQALANAVYELEHG